MGSVPFFLFLTSSSQRLIAAANRGIAQVRRAGEIGLAGADVDAAGEGKNVVDRFNGLRSCRGAGP